MSKPRPRHWPTDACSECEAQGHSCVNATPYIEALEARLAEAERLLRQAELLIVDLARTAVPVPLMGGPTTVVGAIRTFLAQPEKVQP